MCVCLLAHSCNLQAPSPSRQYNLEKKKVRFKNIFLSLHHYQTNADCHSLGMPCLSWLPLRIYRVVVFIAATQELTERQDRFRSVLCRPSRSLSIQCLLENACLFGKPRKEDERQRKKGEGTNSLQKAQKGPVKYILGSFKYPFVKPVKRKPARYYMGLCSHLI